MSDYRICNKCVMDNVGDALITFDSDGVCNYCYEYQDKVDRLVYAGEKGQFKVKKTIQQIKADTVRSKYDCILGLSGGVDSSYLAYKAHQLGLRPLCVHFDNGWNSELAVNNIQNIVNKLGFDLKTFVINWGEFRDLQKAYLKASVIDVEAITDHAIFASIYRIAIQEGIKYILSGANVVTEGILPRHWTHKKTDYINILDIHRQYGTGKLKSFPLIDKQLKKTVLKSDIQIVDLLNWINYNKNDAKKQLKDEFGWRDYGGKHYESIFTKFYQAHILPVKFNVDKRKAHLSTLINSGQVTRDEALSTLKSPLYEETELAQDKEFVLKKLGYSEDEFTEIMNLPIRNHDEFEVEGSFFNYYPWAKPLKPLWLGYKALMYK